MAQRRLTIGADGRGRAGVSLRADGIMTKKTIELKRCLPGGRTLVVAVRYLMGSYFFVFC